MSINALGFMSNIFQALQPADSYVELPDVSLELCLSRLKERVGNFPFEQSVRASYYLFSLEGSICFWLAISNLEKHVRSTAALLGLFNLFHSSS
jgi:hypothetical protein